MPNARETERYRQESRILTLMRAHDSRAIKNGIQGAYEFLRAHPGTSTAYVQEVRYELSRHLTNQDPLITPWIYSLIACLADEQYEPYLTAQLRNHEFDPVNRTWAVASLARVSADYQHVLHSIDDDHTLSYRLAAAMYRGSVNYAPAVREASDTEDRLAHLWVCLLFSEGRATIPIEQVTELTTSRDAEVAQYALFALHKRPRTGIESVGIGPQDLMNLQPRVRRWYYQVLIKDPSNLGRFGSLIRDWLVTERHTQAREGLAKAFIGLQPPREWIHDLRSWAESEQDPYVLDALQQIQVVQDIVLTRRIAQGNRDSGTPTPRPMDRHQAPTYIMGGFVTVTTTGGITTMDMRDQSVHVTGSHHTIGTVQGAYSVAHTAQTIGASGGLDDEAPRLIGLLTAISAALRTHEDRTDDAALVDVVAEDIRNESSDAASTDDGTRMARLKARFTQAGLALAALTGVTAETNELVEQAQELIRHVL